MQYILTSQSVRPMSSRTFVLIIDNFIYSVITITIAMKRDGLIGMRSKKTHLTPFSRAIHSHSMCLRPDNIEELEGYLSQHAPTHLLARGAGLSYNDSCLNQDGYIIDTQRFNHLMDFNQETGVVICQGNVPIKDLFLLHPDYIPPVIPGTVYATVAGGIAHDIHGKNNHLAGSFGHHILWFDLLLNNTIIRCSPNEHSDLFKATISGLGLTGIITKVALGLKKSSRFIQAENKKFDSLNPLIHYMSTIGLNNDYQAAWLDLLNPSPKALLLVGNSCESLTVKKERTISIPKLPCSLLHSWNMKLFNTFYFKRKKESQALSLEQFNNPLDKIKHWDRFYGPQGFIQFQAVFDQHNALQTIEHLIHLIRMNKATPTLAVLKLFIQSGEGYLSFCKPGFTLAIDFIHNQPARQAISKMNEYLTEIKGQVYLAKDLLLNPEQFRSMYKKQEEWMDVLKKYHCTMQSNLSQRLGITP